MLGGWEFPRWHWSEVRIRPNGFVGAKLAREMKGSLLEAAQTLSLASAGFATLFMVKSQSRG